MGSVGTQLTLVFPSALKIGLLCSLRTYVKIWTLERLELILRGPQSEIAWDWSGRTREPHYPRRWILRRFCQSGPVD